MSRYVIETVECCQDQQLQVAIITGQQERWEDVLYSLKGNESVYPVGCSMAIPGPRWGRRRKGRGR